MIFSLVSFLGNAHSFPLSVLAAIHINILKKENVSPIGITSEGLTNHYCVFEM